ncbi:hypothetical protein D2E22_0254 [Bifidobacterium castoris]|uniref:Uncharacterized protein n=2 Tax=Bifidobacterium castoris TaxID=2306972 RepID=A0A430FAD9_9BIFI|nr:hypothetical protein D2E22_0254 [Bifidobacterium castoris]
MNKPHDGAKHRSEPDHAAPVRFLRQVWRWVQEHKIISVTIAALFAIVPIWQGEYGLRMSARQHDESGPVYSWFMLDHVNPGIRFEGNVIISAPAYPIVVTNRGRTDGSIMGVDQIVDGRAERMTPCVPDFNEDGELNTARPVRPDSAKIRIPAEESALMILVAEETRTPYDPATGAVQHGAPFQVTDMLRIRTASGRQVESARIMDVPVETRTAYEYPQMDEALKACIAHVEDGM